MKKIKKHEMLPKEFNQLLYKDYKFDIRCLILKTRKMKKTKKKQTKIFEVLQGEKTWSSKKAF